MPAVDLLTLRARAAALVNLFDQPEPFLKSLRQLLEATSDASYRQSIVVHAHMPLKGYGTPLPVLRAVASALKRSALASPPQALRLAGLLWSAGTREERRLAAELVGLVAASDPEGALRMIEAWLPDLDSLETADMLAAAAARPLMLADPRARLLDARRWVNAEARWVRRFGAAALGELARAQEFQDVDAVLAALRGAMTESKAEVRRAVAANLRDLTPKSAGDVARFLREWAQVTDKNTRWMVKHGMTRLDPQAQSELTALMRRR